MNIKEFIEECRKRTIFRSISIYVVSIWVIIQVAATTFPYLGFPQEAVSLVIICGLIGFPLIMIFSWYYNVVPEQKGKIISLHPEDSHPDQIKDSLFRRVFFTITALVSIGVLIVISILISRNFRNATGEETMAATDSDDSRIAVLTFQNNTGDESLDIVGEMAADRIAHSITQNNIGTVISNDIYEDYSDIFEKGLLSQSGNLNVQQYLDVAQMITGNYYVDNDQLLIDCKIVDAHDGRILKALETIQTLKIKPLDGVERLKQAILGYLATTASTPQLIIETHTPNFDAYRHLLLAKSDLQAKNRLQNLERAIVLDPDYFEPKLLRLSYYYNQSDYPKVDSLYTILQEETIEADERQLNLLAFYEALIAGNNRKIFQTYLTEYNFAPFDMPSNLTMMVLALQFVNKPENAVDYYLDIPREGLNFATCSRCATRAYVYAMSLLELEKYEEAKAIIGELILADDNLRYNQLLLKAHSRLKDWKLIEEVLTQKAIMQPSQLVSLNMSVARECLLMNEEVVAVQYLNSAKSKITEDTDPLLMAEVYYLLNEYELVIKSLEFDFSSTAENIERLSWLSSAYFASGKKELGEDIQGELADMKIDFGFGAIAYAMARIEFAKGNSQETFKLLQKSVAEGIRFRGDTFQNDPFFVTLHDEKTFEDILSFWH